MFFCLSHPVHGIKKLHIDENMAITTKHRRTVLRWIAEPDSIDGDSLKLLTLYAFGLIPSLGQDWDKFYVAGGNLFNPDQPRFFISAFELGNLWLTYQLNTEYKRQIAELKPPFKRPEKRTAEIIDFMTFLRPVDFSRDDRA